MADAHYLTYGDPHPGLSFSFTNFTLNGGTDQVEWIVQAEAGVVITKLGFRYGLRTGTDTTLTYKISIQGVTIAGVPDGTIKGGGTPASKTFVPPGNSSWDGTWQWITLDNAWTVPDGDNFIAIVIAWDSGTISGANSSSFTSRGSGVNQGFPCSIDNDAGARTRGITAPIYGYASASRVYGRPCSVTSSHTFNSGTGTADEYAIKFTIPAAWGDTYKLIGIRGTFTLAAGGSLKVNLYGGTDTTAANSTGATTEVTIHQDVTLDQDFTGATFSAITDILFDEATLVTLYAGATYRIGFQPQNTNNVTIVFTSVGTEADLDALNGGVDVCKSARLNAGNWTDTETDRLQVGLIFRDFTEPTGGGGGMLVHPGLSGGMRG